MTRSPTLCLRVSTGVSDDSVVDTLLAFYERDTNLARLWHLRLGHQNASVVSAANRLMNLGVPKQQLQSLDNCDCDTCFKAKGRRTKIGSEAPAHYQPTQPMQWLYYDIIGPVSEFDGRHKNRVPTLGGNLYALVMVEGYTSYVTVRLMKTKDEAPDLLQATILALESRTKAARKCSQRR